jgi:pimeloyl-ACP methyl ester carboxylesterase
MNTRLARLCTALLVVILTSTGCVFSNLKNDLKKLEEVTYSFSGSVTTEELESDALVIIALHDSHGVDLAGVSPMSGAGPLEMRLEPLPTYFFGFNDLNKDFKLQPGEPYGWAANGQPIEASAESSTNVHIRITSLNDDQPTIPDQLIDEPLEELLNNRLSFSIGTISSLDNPWFSREQAGKGLWQPFAFMEDGGTGIHFLEPYDPDRTPVLFVHGVNGTPQDFTTLIENLDRTRYQAWIFSYPSGLQLSWVASGLTKFLEILHRRHEFDDLHVVAHSMGGLVSRGGINLCTQNDTCPYLRSYTTISTPWNGIKSLQSGAKWAPTVVPVWLDLDPTSEYVTTLFDTRLPPGLPHQLLFGFRQKSIFGSESSDGVIDLTSQLRHAAQMQAIQVLGYDEGHVSILSNELVLEQVYDMLTRTDGGHE